MGKTLLQIVEAIKEDISGYKITDDFEIPDDLIAEKCHDVREVLIQEAVRNGELDDKYYQRVCCLEVTCHRHGCTVNGVFIPSSEITWEVELPPRIHVPDWKDILYFGTDQFNMNWGRKKVQDWLDLSGNIVTSTLPTYTTVGDTAWLKNSPTSDLKFLCAILLLRDPTTACDWKDDESEYPVPNDYKIQLLVKQDILQTHPRFRDIMHNGTDVPDQPAQQPRQKDNE